MAYRGVYDSFWTDPDVKPLSPDDKLLFLYLITNPLSHLSGIYYLPIVIIPEETGLTVGEVKRGIDTLSKGHHIAFDGVFSVVWVKKMLKHQNAFDPDKPLHNPKIRAAIEKHLVTLHKCPLIKDFLEYYRNLNIGYQYPIDTPSDTPSIEGKGKGKGKGKEYSLPEFSNSSENGQEFSSDTERDEKPSGLSSDSPTTSKKKKRTSLPENYVLSESMLKWVRENTPYIDLEEEVSKCRDHFASNGILKADWDATLRNWFRRAVEYAPNGKSKPAEITGLNALKEWRKKQNESRGV